MANINIEGVIGHFVKAEVELTGYFGNVLKTLEGRIIYSTYQGSLFFLPKGKRKLGYKISEDDIKSVEIIRKDKVKHEEYLSLYKERETIEQERRERLKREYEMREKERQKRIEQQKREREAKIQAEIEEAKQIGDYERIRQEVVDYYKSFKDDFYSESFVENIAVPLIVKITNKVISNVEEAYPKHYFDKKRNPKLCHLLEMKTGIKLTNTQKRNVQIINEYLMS